jgi:hypothetical protein
MAPLDAITAFTPSGPIQPEGRAAPAALEVALADAQKLLGHAETASIALADLGNIQLPAGPGGAATDQAHLRSIATLYLAEELEAALLVPAAELLASLAATGGLPGATGDVGGVAEVVLARFWHARHQRMTAAERRALFARLFGTEGPTAPADPQGVNDDFETLFIDLCEALFKLDEQASDTNYGGAAQQTRLRVAAGELADNLLRHTGSMTMFAAGDLLATVQAALALFKEHSLQRALGAQSVWAAVSEVGRRYLHAEAEAEAHVARGKDGCTVLAWLADVLPQLSVGRGEPLTTLDNPVIPAATEWLQTSLGLGERTSPTSSRG